MEKVKVIQIGTGKMSKYTMRYVLDKGGLIVGAVDVDPEKIGKDIGKIMETNDEGIIITPLEQLSDILKKEKPNVAIVTTMSTINDIRDVVRTCVCNGVNVLTTCEEAFFPSNSNPIVYKELDALAKANHVTILGCGYQDVFWGNMIANICASTARITKIKGKSSYNVEDYGIALAKAHGAGLSKEEFDKQIASTNAMSEEERKKLMDNRAFFPSYMWNVVGWLCDKLNLHITSIKQECIPVLTEEKLESSTLGVTLEPKMVRGMNAIVSATTKEDILLEIECIGKVYTKDEEDINDWTIFGEPTTNVVNHQPDTVLLTCADVINRIPDVIKAPSGFISTSDLPAPLYIVNSFDEYL